MRRNRLRDGVELFIASKIFAPADVAQARLTRAVNLAGRRELDKAIEYARQVMADGGESVVADRQLMLAFCMALNLRHSRNRQRADLDEAIAICRQVLAAMAKVDAD